MIGALLPFAIQAFMALLWIALPFTTFLFQCPTDFLLAILFMIMASFSFPI